MPFVSYTPYPHSHLLRPLTETTRIPGEDSAFDTQDWMGDVEIVAETWRFEGCLRKEFTFTNVRLAEFR